MSSTPLNDLIAQTKMVSWPWDNESAENKDRACGSDTFAYWYDKAAQGDGVFTDESSRCQVVPLGGFRVRILFGNGVIRGRGFTVDPQNEVGIDVDVPPATTLPYILRIGVRQDIAERWIPHNVEQGTPATVPQPPPMRRTTDFFDLVFADITVTPGKAEITAADILDQRFNPDVCGFITPVWGRISEPTLYNQYMAYLEEVRQLLDGIVSESEFLTRIEFGTEFFGVVKEALVSRDAQEHIERTDNPHAVTKEQIGLGNVSNVAALPLTGGTVTGSTTFNQRVYPASGISIQSSFGVQLVNTAGNASASVKIQSNGAIILQSNAGIECVNSAGSAYVSVRASAFIESSSKKYKKNIIALTIDKAKRLLLGVTPKEYDLKSDGTHHFGFIAEEVDKVDKTVVAYDENDEPDGLDYRGFIAPMVVLLQNQQKQIDDLTARVVTLEKEREAQNDAI